jgi:hypothetical protein
MVLLVVSSTVRYKKSSLRLQATYGPDYIVKENNGVTTTIDVMTTMDITRTMVTRTIESWEQWVTSTIESKVMIYQSCDCGVIRGKLK